MRQWKWCGLPSAAGRIQAAEFDLFLRLVVFRDPVVLGSQLVVEVPYQRCAVCLFGAGSVFWDWSIRFGEAACPCVPVELLVSYY